MTALAAVGAAVPFSEAPRAGETPKPWALPDWLPATDGRIETSQGFDVTATSWGAYASAVIAPSGPLDQDGLRLKLYGSYGQWSYDTRRVYCALPREEMKKLTGIAFSAECNAIANRPLGETEADALSRKLAPFGLKLDGDQLYWGGAHRVARYDIAVMPGWQVSGSNLALKAYLGPAMETRIITPTDPGQALSGSVWGARGVIEGWMALGSALWLGADGSYFTGSEAYSAAARLGWQPLAWFGLGPEVAAFGDLEDDSARAGGFLRLGIGRTETTLSAGFAAEHDGKMSPYGAASVYVRF